MRLGPRRAAAPRVGALILATSGWRAGPLLVATPSRCVLAAPPAALVALLVWPGAPTPTDPAAFTRFYMRVWELFFLEYPLVAAAVLTASVF